jgi:hypothetical protein
MLCRWNRATLSCAILFVLLAVAGPALAAGPSVPSFGSYQLAQAVKSTPVGGALRLEGVQVADSGETTAFALERFEVFASDAEITVHGDGGKTTVYPAPKNTYFRGTVAGEPGSRVFLAVLEDATVQGIVTRAGDTYFIGSDEAPVKAAGLALAMRRVDPVLLKASKGEGFACANEKLPPSPQPRENLVLGGSTAAAPSSPVTAAQPGFTARVAIETDFEFYSLFNNTTTATNYIGNLLGYSSTIYVNELNTSLLVPSVSLWTTSSDPWTQTSTLCGLMEFGKYWNQNKTGVSRTTAHFMSGKSLGGGIAWVSVLCGGAFSTGAASSCPGLGAESTPWGGGYGFTASLTGQFNANNPTVMWDIMAVSHEIGHNFSSPHTHCYNGVGGNASPIDQCFSGEINNHGSCYSGPTSLPGPAGAGSGTIMSYCHLVRSSFSDISLTFGTGFAYGVQPGREASQMSSYVVSTASGNASCLAFTSGTSVIFNDGFESGTLSAWQ